MIQVIRSFLYSVGIVGTEQNAKKFLAIGFITVFLLVFYYVCFLYPETSPLLSDFYKNRQSRAGDILTNITSTNVRLKGIFGAVIVSQVTTKCVHIKYISLLCNYPFIEYYFLSIRKRWDTLISKMLCLIHLEWVYLLAILTRYHRN